MAHIAGLIAAGVHPSPVGIADVVDNDAQDIARTSWWYDFGHEDWVGS